MKPTRLEKEVKKEVFEYLQLKGHFWWASNNVGIFDPRKGIHRLPGIGFVPGIPDCNLLKDGVYYAIELKATKGRQSDNQKSFQRKVEAAGGVYLLVRGIDDLMEAGI